MLVQQATRREHTRARNTAPSRARVAKKKKAPMTGASTIGRYFKDEATAGTIVQDQQILDATINELIAYAEKDHAQAETEVEYGEALYNLLKLPIDSQKPIVWAIAGKNNVAKPEYPAEDQARGRGRPQTGRKQLAEALYGRWPDMLTLEGTNKDTRAGMQITDHKRRYMIRAGLMAAPTATAGPGGLSRRVLRKSFEALWTVTKNDREQNFLTSLYVRLGVEDTDFQEWKEEAAAESAA